LLKQREKRFGIEILSDNSINFNLWAPDAHEIKLCIKQPDNSFLELLMEKEKDGWFFINTNKAHAGSEYMFKLDTGLMVPDPCSKAQAEDVHGTSLVINPENFDWGNDINWKGRAWEETVFYEIHTGTFTPEGTFNAIKEKLDYLVSLGITAIELMPIGDFPGNRSWGYDGVLYFAPDRSYGTPDDLKELVKTAHEKGLSVFLDVVYNHFGPEGNYLYVYAKSKFFDCKHVTPWGDAINFENRTVRDFFIQNALFWLEEYRFDGLRLDAVHEIRDDSPINILEELAITIKKRIKNRHIHLVLENDNNIAKFLEKNYVAQWNDDFHHCVHIQITGEKGGYYKDYTKELTSKTPAYFLARALAEGFSYQGEASPYRDNTPRGEKSSHLKISSFINFIQNHDQVGNRAFGERIGVLASKNAIKAAACLYLICPNIPLLFMGEEWGCKTPFMFFCNLGKSLSDSVREGRRKEFSRFPEFADPRNREKIPDPTLKSSFENSKLNWNEQDQEMAGFYKTLLKIRHDHIIPLISRIDHSKSTFAVMDEGFFKVKWFADNGKTLEVIANLSENKFEYDIKQDKNVLVKQSATESQGEITAWSVYWLLE